MTDQMQTQIPDEAFAQMGDGDLPAGAHMTNPRRELVGHKVNPTNDLLLVESLDAPGPGGAPHEYMIITPPPHGRAFPISFQLGPIAEAGVNGVTHEALIAILIDRLEHFEAGPYACDENAAALRALQAAQDFLHARTKNRMARGVEGTHAQ